MSSLAYSDFNENPSMNMNNLTEIEKKRQTRNNITFKKRPTASTSNENSNPDNTENVQNMLKLINDTNGYDDMGDGLADFNPPPRAEVSSKSSIEASSSSTSSASSTSSPSTNKKQPDVDYEKPVTVLQNKNKNDDDPSNAIATAVKPRQYPMPLDSQEGFGSLPKTYASDYYKQYVPYFNQAGSQNMNHKDQILEKLNYMIHLLEEQKDEKTGHVMEEVILYSFLGVFIIFIIDSFARAGKYTR